jgi:hypothetical protein
MTAHHLDLFLVILGPLTVWGTYWVLTRSDRFSDAEVTVLDALAVTPREPLTVVDLRRRTGLDERELGAALARLRGVIRQSNGQITLR